MKNVLVDDKYHLYLGQWFERNNPYAPYQARTAWRRCSKRYAKAIGRPTRETTQQIGHVSVCRKNRSPGMAFRATCAAAATRPWTRWFEGRFEALADLEQPAKCSQEYAPRDRASSADCGHRASSWDLGGVDSRVVHAGRSCISVTGSCFASFHCCADGASAGIKRSCPSDAKAAPQPPADVHNVEGVRAVAGDGAGPHSRLAG